ncbi:MAG: DNA topoisomerase I [Candidatus Bathyarchaeota archaeon]|nr:DNA topoisomerase I [Candidatus Bathyarchaeota archaeon]
MKQVLQSLKHNGIYIPTYDYKKFTVKIQEQTIQLTPKSEQMAVAWIRKRQSAASPPDKVFMKNFMREFLEQLKQENPSLTSLGDFADKYLKKIENYPANDFGNPQAEIHRDIDFSEISNYVEQEKQKKLNMPTELKRQLAEERKQQREKLKETYGFAEADGKKLEIANWTAEPSCLFAGRGDHPQRGRWKEGPSKEDIILNLSPDSPKPEGWKVVWEPDKMYVAKWQDKLTGKVKYVWFSDSAFLKQNREKEKFKKAELLGKQIGKIEAHIMKNLDAEDEKRRKVATVCWLILKPNMRVGDEKDPDEADTVGAITLRPEHIKIEGEIIHFDFLGKDSVRWVKHVPAPLSVIRNIEYFSKNCKEYLFEGIDSKKVSRFLSEKMPGLTAKVFRTWRCTATVKEELENSGVKKDDPQYLKMFAAKKANLKVAEVANHKRKIPPTFDERLAKKEAHLRELEAQLAQRKAEGKKTEALETRIAKARLDVELTKMTRDYNLGTSLKSYIDPMAYVKWAKRVKFDLEKFYPKTLRKKFSWALVEKAKAESECEET